MKKKTIVFVSLFVLLLLLMIPNISAIEYKTVRETVERKTIFNSRKNISK